MPPPTIQSQRGNAGCLALFFGLFALGGAFFLVVIGREVRDDWRSRTVYRDALCTIRSKEMITSRDRDGATYRPEFTYDVEADGRRWQVKGFNGWKISSGGYSRHEAILDRYQIGSRYPCLYDPDNPQHAILERASRWSNLFILLPLLFLTVGVIGIAAAFRPGPLGRRRGELTWLPSSSTRPGETLAVRLAPGAATRWAVPGAFLIALVWNGLSWGALFAAAHKGKPVPIFIYVFLGLFALVGVFIFWIFVRTVIVALLVRPTRVEISPGELLPGTTVEVLIDQPGPLDMRRFDVRLVCVESYQTQGEESQRRSEKLLEIEITEQEPCRIERGSEPKRRQIQIPPDAMHSFVASRHRIEWKVVVRGEPERWPKFEREFPVCVLPGSSAAKVA